MLVKAPTLEAGTALLRSQLVAVLRCAGWRRYLEARAGDQQALRSEQLSVAPRLSTAVGAIVAINAQVAALEAELSSHFDEHPDAETLRSLLGLGPVLAPRVLAEFGDDSNRYADAKSRKNYAGTSSIKASGTKRAVLARAARNRRLADADSSGPSAPGSLTRSPPALRPAPSRQQQKRPSPGPASRGQPPRRHPARLASLAQLYASRQLYDEAKAWLSGAAKEQAA